MQRTKLGVSLLPAQRIHDSLLSLLSQSLWYTVKNGTCSVTGGVLDLLAVWSGGYPDLFLVEPVEYHATELEMSSLLGYCMRSPVPKLMPPCTKWCLLWFWCWSGLWNQTVRAPEVWNLQLCLCSWSNQINWQDQQFFVWVYLLNSPFPLAAGGAQFTSHWLPLVTATPHCCLHCFPMFSSLQVHVFHQPILSYFLEYALSASPWVMILRPFKNVLALFPQWG